MFKCLRVENDIPDAEYVLNVTSSAHVLHAFVNGAFVGESPHLL